MRNSKKSIKLAVLLFAMIFVVGAAFAATNGMLTFGGTVRIANTTVTPVNASLEFTQSYSNFDHLSHVLGISSTIHMSNYQDTWRRDTLNFEFDVRDPVAFMHYAQAIYNNGTVRFQFRNTGDVPVRLLGMEGTDFDLYLLRLLNFTTSEWFMHGDYSWQNSVIHPGEAWAGSFSLCPSVVEYNMFNDYEVSFVSNFRLLYEVAQ